jgi:hypothetical protein
MGDIIMKMYKYENKICKKCNNTFRPLKENQLYCSQQCSMIKSQCSICNNEFEYHYLKLRIYCSKKCSGISRQTKITTNCVNCGNKYKAYNTNSKYCSRICKDAYQKVMFVGNRNPNYGNSKLKNIPRSYEDIEKIRIGVINTWKNPTRRLKNQIGMQRFADNNGGYPSQREDIREKIRITTVKQHENNNCLGRFKHGKYVSSKTNEIEYYQSSYEYTRMVELDNDDNVVHWTKKHKIRIRLKNNKIYIPDFLITYNNATKVLEEVKGFIYNKEIFDMKVEASNEYIIKNGISEYVVNFMEYLNK